MVLTCGSRFVFCLGKSETNSLCLATCAGNRQLLGKLETLNPKPNLHCSSEIGMLTKAAPDFESDRVIHVGTS